MKKLILFCLISIMIMSCSKFRNNKPNQIPYYNDKGELDSLIIIRGDTIQKYFKRRNNLYWGEMYNSKDRRLSGFNKIENGIINPIGWQKLEFGDSVKLIEYINIDKEYLQNQQKLYVKGKLVESESEYYELESYCLNDSMVEMKLSFYPKQNDESYLNVLCIIQDNGNFENLSSRNIDSLLPENDDNRWTYYMNRNKVTNFKGFIFNEFYIQDSIIKNKFYGIQGKVYINIDMDTVCY